MVVEFEPDRGRAEFACRLEHLMAQGVQRVRMRSQQIELNVLFEDTVVNGFHTSENISFCHKVRRAAGRVWGVP